MSEAASRLGDALADRYRIERELGGGGMATVYLATDLKHRRQVAIKVLKPELAEALGPERFLREIETTASLRHPHILPLYDSGVVDGLLFYVMPLIEGESVRDRLDREKQLPLADAVAIAREVADALAHAHARGVVHRDVSSGARCALVPQCRSGPPATAARAALPGAARADGAARGVAPVTGWSETAVRRADALANRCRIERKLGPGWPRYNSPTCHPD